MANSDQSDAEPADIAAGFETEELIPIDQWEAHSQAMRNTGFFSVGGFRSLLDRIEETGTTYQMVLKMLKERVACEDAYAAALRKWHDTWRTRFEGSLHTPFTFLKTKHPNFEISLHSLS